MSQYSCKRIRTKGASLGEYALGVGLVAGIAVAAATLMGDSIIDLLDKSTTELSTKGGLRGAANSFDPVWGNQNKPLTASKDAVKSQTRDRGYYALTFDPETGEPVLKLADSSVSQTNVTSVDGHTHTLGTVRLADKLDALTKAQTDPTLKGYYEQMAKWAYYLGGAEGELDGVNQLELKNYGDAAYTKGDALRDIYHYRQKLETLISNPPPNANMQELKEVLPYAADTLNIAQGYLNAFDKFIDADGKVAANFGIKQSGCIESGCPIGDGFSGSSLAFANKVSSIPNGVDMVNRSYDQLVPLSALKDNAHEVLTENRVASAPVTATMTDAVAIDEH